MTDLTSKTPDNWLLRGLPDQEETQLADFIEYAEILQGESLYVPDEPIQYAFFPENGLISISAPLDGSKLLECAVVGREGLVGAQLVLQGNASPQSAVCQVNSKGWRVSADKLQLLMQRSPSFEHRVLVYVQNLVNLIAQNNACNCVHSVEQRYARWLLQAADCLDSKVFPITQSVLAGKLGVRRGAVNGVATQLQKDNLISYTHGLVTILDRAGLQQRACQCYSAVKDFWQPIS